MKTIWVTGASGQVGQTFRALSEKNKDFRFLFTDSQVLDLTDFEKIRLFLAHNTVDYCINGMAYTAVDRAESEVAKAHLLNAEVPKNLALICGEYRVRLVHISTDFVFDGQKNKAYSETDSPNPLGVYGKSKLEGEKAILAANAESLIVRTAWVYSTFGNNFMKTMLRLAEKQPELGVVGDQVGTPTFAADLAEAILHLVRTDQRTALQGIFHYTNEGLASWYDFAHAIFRLAKKTVLLKPILTENYPTPASRPVFSVLDKTKIKTLTGLYIPHWQESLEKCLVGE